MDESKYNDAIMRAAICDWVMDALDGKPVSDFAESFPEVRKAQVMHQIALRADAIPDPADASRSTPAVDHLELDRFEFDGSTVVVFLETWGEEFRIIPRYEGFPDNPLAGGLVGGFSYVVDRIGGAYIEDVAASETVKELATIARRNVENHLWERFTASLGC